MAIIKRPKRFRTILYNVKLDIRSIASDGCRFVKGSDGSVYYTDDHYKTFTKLE